MLSDAHLEETLAKGRNAKLTQMVRLGAGIRVRDAKGRIFRSLIAFSLVSCVVVPLVASAQSSDLASEAHSQSRNRFLVSSSLPYTLPASFEGESSTLSAMQIGKIAADRCGSANLVTADSQSRSSFARSLCNDNKSELEVMRLFECAVACRLRQTASSNAMKLHYGIAACLLVERTLSETTDLLGQQQKAQDALVEKGIPISDPLLVQRLKIQLEDKRLENQSKIALLRSQLAALIGTENACRHVPVEPKEIVPSDQDVCEHIQQALRCRCDLQTMIRLRKMVNADTLTAWDGIGAMLSGVPVLAKPKPFWSKLLRTKRSQAEIQSAVAARLSWLDDLISERTKQIEMEVETAFEKKKTAALRWVKSGEQIANWGMRIEQLEKLAEVQGNLASQYEAKLNRLQAEGQRASLWAEWHLANEDLKLSIGCDL